MDNVHFSIAVFSSLLVLQPPMCYFNRVGGKNLIKIVNTNKYDTFELSTRPWINIRSPYNESDPTLVQTTNPFNSFKIQ